MFLVLETILADSLNITKSEAILTDLSTIETKDARRRAT